MTPERRTPDTLEGLLEDLLNGVDHLVGATVQQAANIDRLAEELTRRPTKAETKGFLGKAAILALLVNVVFLVLVWSSLAHRQRQIADIADDTRTAAEDARFLASQNRPCNPGDDPALPSCVRAERQRVAIAEILKQFDASVAARITEHDTNTRLAHETLTRGGTP